MSRSFHLPAILLIALLVSPWRITEASEYRQTDRFALAVEKTLQYAEEFGNEQVLFVLDIDNTLLAMDRDLGSDQWFEWQDYLLSHEPDSPHAVAKDFDGLLEVQGILFAGGRMHPPEPTQPAQVSAVQELGIDTLVMTARGDDFRAATIRELKRAGYEFSKRAPACRLHAKSEEGMYETCSRFTPYFAAQPQKYGITKAEFNLFGLSTSPRQVSYGDGVLMLAGQHKGAMLLMMMQLLDKPYKAVVFVDDNGKNVTRVYDALVRRNIEVAALHYTHEDDRVARFTYGDKQKVSDQWQAISKALGR